MKKKNYKSSDTFIKNLLKDPEIRVYFERERSITAIAEAVRSARMRADLTQVELAQRAKTTQAVISRLESGSDSRVPSLELLSKIAGACKAKLSFSFSFEKKAA
jgi:ribosome-binding protein aMBF1 (putative translation factor)